MRGHGKSDHSHIARARRVRMPGVTLQAKAPGPPPRCGARSHPPVRDVPARHFAPPGPASGLEIGRSRVGRLYRDRRAPRRKKISDACFCGRIARGWRVRDPEVQLERPVALRSKFRHPVADPFGARQEGAHRAHTARVCRGDCQAGRTRPGHRGFQHGQLQAVAPAKSQRSTGCIRGLRRS